MIDAHHMHFKELLITDKINSQLTVEHVGVRSRWGCGLGEHRLLTAVGDLDGLPCNICPDRPRLSSEGKCRSLQCAPLLVETDV